MGKKGPPIDKSQKDKKDRGTALFEVASIRLASHRRSNSRSHSLPPLLLPHGHLPTFPANLTSIKILSVPC